ncbi:MAG TPA: helix-turn-helix transcriptional regulator [Candidatus Aphodovivens excrementavium]|nr:helix-turn-helix transcriptional regulator [Candidatus Aphodovivens excrementavium]
MTNQPVKPHRARLGRNIRILRIRRGLSLRKFGQMIGVDYAYLSNIETAKANTTVDVLAKIADGLEVDIRDLF